jgi:transketolase
MEILSKVHGKNLIEWAADKPDVIVLSADLTSSCEVDLFRDKYPDRFISLGIAEQNMHSFAAGLAREGFYPFIHTFAVFIYRRSFDQIAMSIAYPNLPVRMFGFLPGVLTPGGATHQAIEDIALMRALPNMTVLETGDATDIESVLDAAQGVDGPVYIRMLRGEVPRLFNKNDRMKLGKARHLSSGNDITLLTSGICTEEAMRVTSIIAGRGLSIDHYHITTLKPFNDPIILESACKARLGVITMENHTVDGGLGTCAAEMIAGSGIGKKLVKIGIRDTFLHGASKRYLMKEYEIDALTLVKEIEALSGGKFNITEKELDEVRIEAVHSESKAEAL